MILIIDNYDSFVENIARYIRELGEEAMVRRNDAVTVADVEKLGPRAILLSPGPRTPREAGICNRLVECFSGRIPLLGICLGHQCIGAVFGGRVRRAREPMHGRASLVTHEGQGIFRGLANPLRVGRYHSLIVEIDDANAPLQVTAHSRQGEIMGLAHRAHPTFGVQFHPESILTEGGHAMLANFLHIAAARETP